MGDIVLTTEYIESDVEKLLKSAESEFIKIKTQIEFKHIIEAALAKSGYSFSVDDNGNFRIAAAPGMYVGGIWDSGRWAMNLSVSYGNIHVDKTTSKYMYPATFAKYLPVLDSVISSLKEKYAEYEAKTKAKKSSELLQSLVRRELRQLHITDTQLEPSDMGNGLLKLQKRIAPKKYLTTTLDFDNYKERCLELKSSLEQLSSTAQNDIPKSITYINEQHGEAIDVIPRKSQPGEEIKMFYTYAPQVKIGNYNPELCDPEIVKALSDLGFVFVIRSNEFHIRINRYMSLYRNGTQTWFADTRAKDIKQVSDKQDIPKDIFISLIAYMARASMALHGYDEEPVWNWNESFEHFVTYLRPIFKTCLPSGCFVIEDYYVWIKVFFLKSSKIGVKWSRNRSSWLEDLFYVIENFDYLKNTDPEAGVNDCLRGNLKLKIR